MHASVSASDSCLSSSRRTYSSPAGAAGHHTASLMSMVYDHEMGEHNTTKLFQHVYRTVSLLAFASPIKSSVRPRPPSLTSLVHTQSTPRFAGSSSKQSSTLQTSYMGTVLQGTVKPSTFLLSTHAHLTAIIGTVTTQCSIHELYLQGKSQQPVVDLAKTFERRKFTIKKLFRETSISRASYVCVTNEIWPGETNTAM